MRKILSLCRCQSLHGEEGRIVGKGAAFEFFRIFWSNSPPLGLENCSNPITYPFLHFRKLQFGAKFVVKIPMIGTKEVPPSPYKHICTCITGLCAGRAHGGRWCPTFALGWLQNSYKSYAKHPRFYRFRALGSLKFSLDHSLALHWQLKYLRDRVWWLLKYC